MKISNFCFSWLPGTCLDDSWIHPRNLTPSSPKDVKVRLQFAHTQHGDHVPVLQIKWTLQTDASILYLEGAELSVLQLNTNERLCVKFEFLSKLRSHHKRWHFTFSHFVVEPGQEYEVTVHHLPKPIPDGDPNHQSMNYLVPGCEDPEMRITTPCVSSGNCGRQPHQGSFTWLHTHACSSLPACVCALGRQPVAASHHRGHSGSPPAAGQLHPVE